MSRKQKQDPGPEWMERNGAEKRCEKYGMFPINQHFTPTGANPGQETSYQGNSICGINISREILATRHGGRKVTVVADSE